MSEIGIEKPSWVQRWTLSGWKSYAMAISLTLVVMTLRVALIPVLGEAAPYAVFAPVLVVVSFIGGPREAAVACVLALVISWTFVFHATPLVEKLATTIAATAAMMAVVLVVTWQRELMERLAFARQDANLALRRAEDAQERAEAERDRAALLSRELNHRVKNLFAVVSSIVSLSGRSEPEAREAVEKIKDRIGALATAHTVGLADDRRNTATLGQIVETMLRPYQNTSCNITIGGPEAALPFEAVTPLALILHELSTNAVKYGALCAQSGEVRATWTKTDDDLLTFTWEETGGPVITDEPEKRGFGSTMLKQAERQLGATVTRDWSPSGLVLTMAFPLHRSKPSAPKTPKE